MIMKKQIILKIYGKVQGVFFRDSSRIQAQEFGLSGWVRNEPDETVRMMAEGEDKNLKKFIAWCKYGPDHAEVERVDVKWLPFAGEFIDFVIK